MHFGGPIFVVSIIALSLTAWLINSWIRARHGFSVSDDWGRQIQPGHGRDAELMAAENARLKASLGRLEERIAVLERITTDAPARLSAEIESLRG